MLAMGLSSCESREPSMQVTALAEEADVVDSWGADFPKTCLTSERRATSGQPTSGQRQPWRLFDPGGDD